MALYKLPLGIRIPHDDEYPKNHDVKSINTERNLANIVEGFVTREVSGQKYSAYVEANIDADKIWDIFCDLAKKLFDYDAYGIISFKDEKPKLSRFTKTEEIIKVFDKYQFELTNDGYLEFGIAYYDDHTLNEIFVSSFKYMKIWTNEKELVLKTLNNFGIKEIDDLKFIDDFPVVSEALSGNGIRHYSEVIENIEQEFLKL